MTNTALALVIDDAPLDAADHARAILNILDDFGVEKDRLADTQRAVLNVLEDAAAEQLRLVQTQSAMLNILEDFDSEKNKVEQFNADLRRENQERRTLAQTLTERSVDLQRSNADLEQFAYVASHDLQEPLRMVSSYVQLLERRYKGQLDDQADKYIAYAVEGARRMQALIGGLLEYSRAGLDDSLRDSVDMSLSLEQALSNLGSAVEESGAVIVRHQLPLVIGDRAQLTQVLQNLIANAIKFRRPGIEPRVEVSADPRAEDILFEVQDNGIGVDPQYAERVFMIFQRLHTRNEYPGTGIGLSICKKVIERHGGRIWIEPSEGGGAKFRFTLPRGGAAA